MGELRIKYFSQPDLAAGRQLFKVQTLFEHLDENNTLCDINDAIELYNAKRWIDSGDSLPTWSDSQKDNYKTIVKTIIPRQLGVFCSKINDDNVFGFINNLSSQYYNDFWSLFVTYKVYNRISPEKFETILNLEKVHLRIILKYKEIVINYDREIANKLKSSYKYATLLVSNYLEYHDERWQPLYFPTTLSNSDKTKLIDDYINSEDPNPNIIELISLSQSSNDLPLSDFTLNGRRKGELLSYGVMPCAMPHRNDLTSLLMSCTQVSSEYFPDGCPAMVSLNKKDVQKEGVLNSLIRTFFEAGGFHLAVNTVDAKLLEQAKENPAEYQDIMVKISGYSAQFTTLRENVQDAVIERAVQEK